MFSKESNRPKDTASNADAVPAKTGQTTKASRKVTEARATAQRAKLDRQAETRKQTAQETASSKKSGAKKAQPRRAQATVEYAIDDYLLDHRGGNHSEKTLEWHRTALRLMQSFLEKECQITLVEEIDAPEINAWFAHLRTTPDSRGKPRAERTIQTYAPSARAFFHWLVGREMIERNHFDRVVFPKVGKPLIQTISAEEFERLLLACTPPHESGPIAERAAVRNFSSLTFTLDEKVPTTP